MSLRVKLFSKNIIKYPSYATLLAQRPNRCATLMKDVISVSPSFFVREIFIYATRGIILPFIYGVLAKHKGITEGCTIVKYRTERRPCCKQARILLNLNDAGHNGNACK